MLGPIFTFFVVTTIAFGLIKDVVVPTAEKAVTYTQEVIVPSVKSAVNNTVDAADKLKDKVTEE